MESPLLHRHQRSHPWCSLTPDSQIHRLASLSVPPVTVHIMQPHCPHASNMLLNTQALGIGGAGRKSRGMATFPEACPQQRMLEHRFVLRRHIVIPGQTRIGKQYGSDTVWYRTMQSRHECHTCKRPTGFIERSLPELPTSVYFRHARLMTEPMNS